MITFDEWNDTISYLADICDRLQVGPEIAMALAGDQLDALETKWLEPCISLELYRRRIREEQDQWMLAWTDRAPLSSSHSASAEGSHEFCKHLQPRTDSTE